MMHRPLFYLGAAWGLFAFCATGASAQAPLHQRIDQLMAAGQPELEKQAAPPASDAEFLRRVSLDLTGVVPTAAEARAFLADASPTKRQELIDRLLVSPAYAWHMQNVFDVMLLERRPDRTVPPAQWQEFLRTSFAANKPWDQLVREILTADGFDAKTRPAVKFHLSRQGEPQTLALDISRIFLGMNFQCAQCHDHPLVPSYKQEHFYGVLAFLNRSYQFADPKVVVEKRITYFAEKAEGEVTFQSVFDPNKVSKTTGPRLPEGTLLHEPTFDKAKAYMEAAPGQAVPAGATYQPPVPKFSRRTELALQLTIRENAQLRRTSANRLWALLMGRGLVHPVDLDHPENPPSHPELLTLLAEQLAAMKFDVRAFLRELALTQTYQRSSELSPGKEQPPPERFAVALLKPLTPEQLAWSLMQATGLWEAERLALGGAADDEPLRTKLAAHVVPFVTAFGGQPGQPQTFQTNLDQPLFLANGPLLRGWLAPRPGNLTERLARLAEPDAVADELFVSVLTRPPTEEERREVRAYLNARPQERTTAVQDLVWGLLTSIEFRFCP